VSAEQRPRHRVDVVALVAGLLFIMFSVGSLTIGSLDFPSFGAAPLWVFMILAGGFLLLSEIRGRRQQADAIPPDGSPELAAWEQDTFR